MQPPDSESAVSAALRLSRSSRGLPDSARGFACARPSRFPVVARNYLCGCATGRAFLRISPYAAMGQWPAPPSSRLPRLLYMLKELSVPKGCLV